MEIQLREKYDTDYRKNRNTHRDFGRKQSN